MRSSLEQKEDALRVTTEGKNKFQVKENNHLFNHIDKLAADHDVTVSNTMIKITYKKALKDQNASESLVDCNNGTDADMVNIKAKSTESKTVFKSDISLVLKPAVVLTENKIFHSISKPPDENEKRKKYINGLDPSPKSNNFEEKSSLTKVQKRAHEGSQSLKKPKIIPNKQIIKPESDKKFLKDNSLVKRKEDIFPKNSADLKKIKFKKPSNKKIKKLDNGTKKKAVIDKKNKKAEGLKRKLSSTGLGLMTKYKRVKVGESNPKLMEGDRCLKENDKSGSSKKPIMLVDPDLPTGWTRFIRTKNKGLGNEQYIVYIVNPQGKKFRFKWKLRKYLQRTNSSLDADQFFFGLYPRPKTATSNTSGMGKREALSNNEAHVSVERSSKVSRRSESDTSPEVENDIEENEYVHDESKNDASKSTDRKKLLLFDPDLPFGWKRIIHSDSASGRKQVHIISPDGKIFRRRYRLNEYLIKHQYTHNLDRFYFGLYPKKEGSVSDNSLKEMEEKISSCVKSKYRSVSLKPEKESSQVEENQKASSMNKRNRNYLSLIGKRRLCLILRKIDESSVSKIGDLNSEGSAMNYNKTPNSDINFNKKDDNDFKDVSKIETSNSPMYVDPNLPKGWKRFIKIRSCGESAGRMEVIIVSPDGRKHRSRKHLEHYLSEKHLKYKAENFDFTVFGRANVKKRPKSIPAPVREFIPESEPNDLAFLSMKKKFTDKPVPDLDICALKDTVITPEGHMINTVNGLMMCSGLSSIRNERRSRLPRVEHEKQLKSYLSSEGDLVCDGCDIPTNWIQRLVKCRSDFRILEPDAVSTIAEATKKFIKKLSLQALASSKKPESGLKYEDVAELVDRIEGLPFLKTLIPKKITFKEYIKLNRPKQFMSFT